MSRTAQDVLEFDKLRELLRLRTTCAPGRRAVDALEFGTDRAALEAAFALIREAREWLRGGGELGFGGLADPQDWLEKIEGPGIVLEAKELSGRGVAGRNRGDGCGGNSGKTRRNSLCWPHASLRSVSSARCSPRSDDACCRMARSATTRRRRCAAFARASPSRANRSRKR